MGVNFKMKVYACIITIVLCVLLIAFVFVVTNKDKNDLAVEEPTDTTIVIETEPETEQTFDKTEEKHTYTLDKEYAELLSKAESNVETVSINDIYTEKWEELAQIYYEKILYSIENNTFADEFYGEGTNEKALLMMEQWQTDWNNYYELQTNYYNEFLEYNYGAGSIVPVVSSKYKMNLARERALELYDMCLLLYIDVEAP